MGSPLSEAGRSADEGPRHSVTLTHGFWLGEAPVTQQQWAAVSGSNPSHFEGDDLPVEQVSWHDCAAWMAQASASAGELGLRFPTEAEWEYAYRAGTTGARFRGGSGVVMPVPFDLLTLRLPVEVALRGWTNAAKLDGIAWYDENSGGKTHPVKQKAANPWGLYDMLGNVWEWCADSQRTYKLGAVVDPSGGAGARRVRRGGSWRSDAHHARAAARFSYAPSNRSFDLGFRLARGQ